MRGLKIGITIGIRQPNESLWTNGIKQNALFLAKLLMKSSHGHPAYPANWHSVGRPAAGTGFRQRHDMLATTTGLAGRRCVGTTASGDASPVA